MGPHLIGVFGKKAGNISGIGTENRDHHLSIPRVKDVKNVCYTFPEMLDDMSPFALQFRRTLLLSFYVLGSQPATIQL